MHRMLERALSIAVACGMATMAFAQDVVIDPPWVAVGDLQPAPGTTANQYVGVYFAQGAFNYVGNKQWVELNSEGRVAFNFIETGRFDSEIKLWDASRKIHISLNLGAGMIMYAEDGQPLAPLYPIIGGATGQVD